jgi:hypothetical protein
MPSNINILRWVEDHALPAQHLQQQRKRKFSSAFVEMSSNIQYPSQTPIKRYKDTAPLHEDTLVMPRPPNVLVDTPDFTPRVHTQSRDF